MWSEGKCPEELTLEALQTLSPPRCFPHIHTSPQLLEWMLKQAKAVLDAVQELILLDPHASPALSAICRPP